MAFFEDLGKKISQGSQDVIKKTNEMAAIARVNSRISAEEKELVQKYQQIGQRFYSEATQAGDSAENITIELYQALMEMCQGVSDSLRNIESCKEEIVAIRNVKRCTNCGAECPNDAPFCSACGHALPIPAAAGAAAGRTCPNCNKALSADAIFCTGCGQQVPVDEAPQAEEAAGKFCSGCGKALPANAGFCTGCGNKMQ